MTTAYAQTACNEACWHAREEACRCSCGGTNHGILRQTPGAPTPARTSKIDGYMYQLWAVADYPDATRECRRINGAEGMPNKGTSRHGGYVFTFSDSDKGAPARRRLASVSEFARWPEVSSFKSERHPGDHYRPDLVWVRTDLVDAAASVPE